MSETGEVKVRPVAVGEIVDRESKIVDTAPSPSTSSPASPYTLVLTHDVDHLCMRRARPFSRRHLALVKDLVARNFVRLVTGRISLADYAASLALALKLPLVMFGLVSDPWEKSIEAITTLEEEFGFRSTFFFMPFADEAGHTPAGLPAPVHRASNYRLADYRELLGSLVERGWEVGLHGIDCHTGEAAARRERAELARVLGAQPVGCFMHERETTEKLNQHLKDAGFAYNATLGYNDRVGFPDGRARPYVEMESGLAILPLAIQDCALLRADHANLAPGAAWERISRILESARENGAVVTVLWHNDSFLPPRCWHRLYRRLLEQARSDNARVVRSIDVVSELGGGPALHVPVLLRRAERPTRSLSVDPSPA